MTKISFDVDFSEDPEKILQQIQDRAKADRAAESRGPREGEGPRGDVQVPCQGVCGPGGGGRGGEP